MKKAPLTDPVEISKLNLKTDFIEISEVRKNTLGTLYIGKSKAQPWKISYEHLPNELLKIKDEDLDKNQKGEGKGKTPSKQPKTASKPSTAHKVKVVS